jgi:hypothetical protein
MTAIAGGLLAGVHRVAPRTAAAHVSPDGPASSVCASRPKADIEALASTIGFPIGPAIAAGCVLAILMR